MGSRVRMWKQLQGELTDLRHQLAEAKKVAEDRRGGGIVTLSKKYADLQAKVERLREAAEPFYEGHQLSQISDAAYWCHACHDDWPCKGELLRRAALAEQGEKGG